MKKQLSELMNYSLDHVRGIDPHWHDSKDTVLRVEIQSAQEMLDKATREGNQELASQAKNNLNHYQQELRDYIDEVVQAQLKFLDFADQYNVDVSYVVQNAKEKGTGYTDNDIQFWDKAMEIAQGLVKKTA